MKIVSIFKLDLGWVQDISYKLNFHTNTDGLKSILSAGSIIREKMTREFRFSNSTAVITAKKFRSGSKII
jgi:hypothetical protein